MSNSFLFANLVGALVLQLCEFYVPALEWVFGTIPLPAAALGRASLTGSAG
jgi:hypothetical protein